MFKLIIVDPMLKHGVLPLVISTIALSLFLKETVKDFYSSQAQPFPALVPATDIHVFGAVISTQSLAVLAVAIVTVVALHLLLNKTRLGRLMQATAQNPTLARILGIPVQRMVLYTFLINAVLVAIASILISPIYLAKFTNGETLGHGGVPGRHHRRLQSSARRHSRRHHSRYPGQSVGRLSFLAISRGVSAA